MENWTHPTGKIPEKIAIVALGPSQNDYVQAMLSTGLLIDFDEVWTVNHGMRLYKHDLAFDCHDYRYLAGVFQEQSKQDAYHKKMVSDSGKPVVMLEPWPDLENAKKFPLEWILRRVGGDNLYFNNTIAYMLAYATAHYIEHKKKKAFKDVSIFGADFDYPGHPHTEAGRGCTEFWVGFGRALKMDIRVCSGSTLTDAKLGRPLYGYIFAPPLQLKKQKA